MILPPISGGALTSLQALGGEVISRLRAALSIGQATRLVQIETSLASTTLVVERLKITEGVHADEPLWAEVDCLSTSAYLELKALTGEPVTVRVQQADGSWRSWHTVAVHAAQLGADGGLARYRLSLAAWTHWLTHRRDTRIFQDQTAQAITDEVFKAYPFAKVRFEVAEPGPVRALTTQYRETDWAFACRLMAAEGWSWRIDHAENEHTLVVFDQQAQRPDLGTLRFSRPDIRSNGFLGIVGRGLVQDTVTAWSAGQQVGTNTVTLAGWDERQLAGVSAQAEASSRPSAIPALESYRGHGERRHADGPVATAQPASSNVADARAAALMAAHELKQHTTQGQSAVRAMSPSATFWLTEHSLYSGLQSADNHFCALSIEHEAANNLGAEAAQILKATDLEQGSYRNQFTAAPAAARVVPEPWHQPTAPGQQTALVMAAPNEPLTTDRDGRVRVQFGWQRGPAPLAGGMTAPSTTSGAPTGHAPGQDGSGTWVRVSKPMAGANWGAVFTPRVGTEVLVDFIDGDIDRPIVVGQLHNGQHDLPWPAGVDAGSNHPGTVSGWHHQHLDQQGANQWLVDDATGQLRMRLASHGASTGWSELTLGRIIQQSGQGGSGHAQRGPWLGEGFYGHTDGWAVVRAGGGLLLSTTARSQRGASVTSTQMDAAEAVGQLKAARQLGDTLSQSARQQGAQGLSSHDAGQAVQQHADTMDPQALGKYTGAVGGQEAKKANGRTLGDAVERFNTPIIHLDTPTTASLVTPASISLFSGQDTSVSLQGDAHLTSAHTLSSVSGQTTSLYTHSGGIKGIAANGPVSLRAHTDSQQVWADQDITLQSTTDEVRIQAKDSITLTAGQSQIVIKGGDITFTMPGKFTVKGASHDWSGGGARSAKLAVLPSLVIEPVPDSHLDSNFAFEQLSVIAKRFTKAEFVALIAPVFGFDIPARTYILLYEGLRSSAIANPNIRVMSGGHYPAAYDNKTRQIFVHQVAADAAAESREGAWLLVTALLHEFGHHIDNVLRADLAEKSSAGAKMLEMDAPGDEGAKFAYAIALFDFAGSDETVYASYQSPSFNGPLKINYRDARQAIRLAQSSEAQGLEGKEESQEYFGAGRGEHHKEAPQTSFGHESIEDALKESSKIFVDPDIRKQIYFGNWLRDFSQVLDPKIVRKPTAPKDLTRHLSRDALTKIVAVLAEDEFVRTPKEKVRYAVTTKRLGVYRPTEHIDNPTNGDPHAENPQSIDSDFEPLPTKTQLAVDPATSMKRYIGASIEYMKDQLNQAVSAGMTSDGFRHFGAALHVLEDYFAHSNFVELSLRKIGHKDVLPWTSTAPGKHAYPLVTGMFDSEDIIASTAGLIADNVFKVQWEFQASKPGERNKSDRLMLILLEEHSDPRMLEAFKSFLLWRDAWARVPGHQYAEGAMHYTLGMVGNAYNFVYGSLLHLLGNSVDDEQVLRAGDPNTNGSTNPTHSQLAKDHDNHPFHSLAAGLAREAVKRVGTAMAARWGGDQSADPALVAASYLVHPNDTAWQDFAVTSWAKAHPRQVKRGASATEWDALRKEHEQEARAAIKKAGRQSTELWEYINKNYDDLFGGKKNQVKK